MLATSICVGWIEKHKQKHKLSDRNWSKVCHVPKKNYFIHVIDRQFSMVAKPASVPLSRSYLLIYINFPKGLISADEPAFPFPLFRSALLTPLEIALNGWAARHLNSQTQKIIRRHICSMQFANMVCRKVGHRRLPARRKSHPLDYLGNLVSIID